MPSFPVNIPATLSSRETSPTRPLYGGSPTSSLTMVGRRSPNHDNQMDSIAEDFTEDLATPTETAPPVSFSIGDDSRPSNSSLSNGFVNEQGYPRPITPNGVRQRKTGAHMVQAAATVPSQQVMRGEPASSMPQPQPHKNGMGLHHLLLNTSTMQQVSTPAPPPVVTSSHNNLVQGSLKGMLLTPVTNNTPPQYHTHLVNTDVIYNASPMNGFVTTSQPNYHLVGMAALMQMQQQLSNRVSSVLDNFGIRFVHEDNIFTVHHHGVQFQIHVARNIQLQYIAGDTNQYQSLCTQLYSRLVAATQ